VITGVHAIIYTRDADADRAFFRDVLSYPFVDAGDGWLIFKLPPAELGIHPADHGTSEGHQLFLMCDNIESTLDELAGKGVEIVQQPQDRGYGIEAGIRLPGGSTLQIYEYKHATAIDL
jgi:catechol 2,3-dioxygenase-like lactoylglutathione lyase family enzyme